MENSDNQEDVAMEKLAAAFWGVTGTTYFWEERVFRIRSPVDNEIKKGADQFGPTP